METAVVSRMLYAFMNSTQFLKCGTVSRKFITLNLLDVLNDWTPAINDRSILTVAHINYVKAFGAVSLIR